MSRDPSYPTDTPVGTPEPGGETPKPADPKRTKHLVAGAAIGIGSAALVAALLYANRSKKSDKTD